MRVHACEHECTLGVDERVCSCTEMRGSSEKVPEGLLPRQEWDPGPESL